MSKKNSVTTAMAEPSDAAPELKRIHLEATTLTPLAHVTFELLEQLENYQQFAAARAFRRGVVDGLRWLRVCLTVLALERELTRLRLSPHNRPPALSGPPLNMTTCFELATWLCAMGGDSADTFGEKVAGRWLDGFLLPASPDGRSATPAEVERWRQTPLPDVSAELRLLRLIADNFRRIVAADSEPPKLRATEQDDGDDSDTSLRRVGKVWRFRYRVEKADFPVVGNQFLGWLAKLLSKPDRSLTVADLLGDPDGKLAADALLGGERLTDKESIRAIRQRSEDIDEIKARTGGSEVLDDERAELLQRIEGNPATGRMGATVCKAYQNITTQKRQFLKKLKSDMPGLAAHLKACILPCGNDCTISYRPPAGTPCWNVENPPK
jgi:hypothetical protein